MFSAAVTGRSVACAVQGCGTRLDREDCPRESSAWPFGTGRSGTYVGRARHLARFGPSRCSAQKGPFPIQTEPLVAHGEPVQSELMELVLGFQWPFRGGSCPWTVARHRSGGGWSGGASK